MEQLAQQMRHRWQSTDQHEQPVPQTRHDQSGVALDVLLKHPAVAAHQQIICSMLQVSKGWREAVQKSEPGLLNISVTAYSQKQLALAGWSVWLPQHHQLVRTIEVYHEGRADAEVSNALVSLSLQSVKNSAHWRLLSFKSNVVASSALLLALPVDALTTLSFNFCWKLSPPIARFSELMQLDVGHSGLSGVSGASTVRQLAALSKLTMLSMCSIDQDIDLSLLPGQLQDLHIWVRCKDRPRVLLQHLTALQSLEISSREPIAASLPPQLQQLTAQRWHSKDEFSVIDTFGITRLQQLRHLNLGLSLTEQLHSLSTLTQLQHFTVDYLGKFGTPTSIWGQLPALCSLDLLAHVEWPAEVRKLTMGLAAATELTSLHLKLTGGYRSTGGEGDSICLKPLSGLTKLFSLSIVGAFNPSHGLFGINHLSVLTGLTKLDIINECSEPRSTEGPWAVTAELSQLLPCLTGLEELAICSRVDQYDADNDDHDLWHLGMMPVVRQLQQLRELDWQVGPELPKASAQHGLDNLVGLSKLTKLVGFENAGHEALDKFWTFIKGQPAEHQ